MTSATKYLCVLFLLFSLIGCGAHTRYEWSGYDNMLYRHYKDPSNKDSFIKELKNIIDCSEPAGKVPPGIYAEYGYVMYEQGNNQQAVMYFQKEADKWPESRFFMTKLIANVNNRARNKKEIVRPSVGPEVDAGKKEIIQPSVSPVIDASKTVPTPSSEVSK